MSNIIDLNTFLQEPLIQKLANFPNWTISDPEKRPLDMFELERGNIRGCNREIPYSTTTLYDIKKQIDYTPNLAFYLTQALTDLVCLDVEKTTSSPIKRNFITTDFIYGEKSLSGKGFHLWYSTPDNFYDYPYACKKKVLREKEGNWELLMDHWVTFTGNTIIKNPVSPTTIESIYADLAQNIEEQERIKLNYKLDEVDVSDIPAADNILEFLEAHPFEKTPQDYPDKNNITGYDMSRYEFSFMCSRYSHLKWFIANHWSAKNHEYTLNELCTLMYKAGQDTLEYRQKHSTFRNGQPWLFYTATQAINFIESVRQDENGDENND